MYAGKPEHIGSLVLSVVSGSWDLSPQVGGTLLDMGDSETSSQQEPHQRKWQESLCRPRKGCVISGHDSRESVKNGGEL